MLKYVAIFCIICLGCFIGYQNYTAEDFDVRKSVNDGVETARKSYKLTPEQEAVLRVQLALVDYIAKNGAPPEALSELVPAYFDSVPKDPATKEPLLYARAGQTFKLGEEVSAAKAEGTTPQGMTATLATVNSKAIKSKPEVFVNPNTMEEDNFVYDPTDKRDPFRPFDMSPKLKRDGLLSPLEQYSIGQLRLTATAKDLNGEMTAIVEDETGRGYPIRVGTKIGNNNGSVVEILTDSIRLVETKIDFSGVETDNVVEMKIQSESKDKGKKAGHNRRSS